MGPTDGHLDEDRIFGLAEGGLNASVRAAAEAHLRGCAACRREVEAAAGYFKETAGLEPVKAPADFLANVRARLPRPSPWRSFLEGFMRPLRLVPMQVALPALLGLMVISSYLYQRGGLNKPSPGVISETASERPQPVAESPATAPESVAPLMKSAKSHSRGTRALGKSEGYAGSPLPGTAAPRAPAPGAKARGAGAPASKRSSQVPSSLQRQALPAQAPSDPQAAAASGSALAGNRAKAEAQPESQPESESRSDGSLRESSSSIASDLAEPAAEAARAEKPRAAREAVARQAAKEKKPEAKDGSGEPPAFILRLAPGKRIGDVVSGLKAMGADSLSAGSAWNDGDTGDTENTAGKGMDYVFQVPASMRKDIAPYLERYGRTEGAGLLPATGNASSRIRIRFLP
jgi:hypothetical protein